ALSAALCAESDHCHKTRRTCRKTSPYFRGVLDAVPNGRLVEVEGAMVSAIKLADDKGGVVVRVFEPAGAHGRLSLRPGPALAPWSTAALTDALERPSAGVEVGPEGRVELDLRPFELLTVVLRGPAPHLAPT
ncbi:MAG: glycosyl hydrolase-related protein, partial [Acidimicrobiales bacterium]